MPPIIPWASEPRGSTRHHQSVRLARSDPDNAVAAVPPRRTRARSERDTRAHTPTRRLCGAAEPGTSLSRPTLFAAVCCRSPAQQAPSLLATVTKLFSLRFTEHLLLFPAGGDGGCNHQSEDGARVEGNTPLKGPYQSDPTQLFCMDPPGPGPIAGGRTHSKSLSVRRLCGFIIFFPSTTGTWPLLLRVV